MALSVAKTIGPEFSSRSPLNLFEEHSATDLQLALDDPWAPGTGTNCHIDPNRYPLF